MQRLVEQVWLSQRPTAILVTHDVAEAVTLADRIVLIEAGAIAGDFAIGLKRPRQPGSADFARIEAAVLERLLALTN
jgi:sulfonate transport system ATP-binding protein